MTIRVLRLLPAATNLPKGLLREVELQPRNASRNHGGLSQILENKGLQFALRNAELMQQQGTIISRRDAFCLVQKCIKEKDAFYVRWLQTILASSGLDSIALLSDHLIRYFGSHECLHEANQLFNKVSEVSVYTWCATISANAKLGQGDIALELYQTMQLLHITSNKFIYLAILKACSEAIFLQHGKLIHDQIIRTALVLDIVLGSMLVDMYSKCRNLEEALRAFDELEYRDVVAWNTLIAGCVQHGEGLLALDLYKIMLEDGMQPDELTFSSILKACGNLGAIEHGQILHDFIIENRILVDDVLGNTMTAMYTKCGNLEKAREIFNKLERRDVISWSTMIGGYALQGNAELARQCFEEICREGIRPNKVVFASVLSACSNAGLVDEGLQYFKIMKDEHCIAPDNCHYNCMIDLLGRAGCWVEANYLLQATNYPNIIGWKSLLSACQVYGYVELARKCFNNVIHLDPNCDAGYVLMANTYATDNFIRESFGKPFSMTRTRSARQLPT